MLGFFSGTGISGFSCIVSIFSKLISNQIFSQIPNPSPSSRRPRADEHRRFPGDGEQAGLGDAAASQPRPPPRRAPPHHGQGRAVAAGGGAHVPPRRRHRRRPRRRVPRQRGRLPSLPDGARASGGACEAGRRRAAGHHAPRAG